jgi:hypothetical protein
MRGITLNLKFEGERYSYSHAVLPSKAKLVLRAKDEISCTVANSRDVPLPRSQPQQSLSPHCTSYRPGMTIVFHGN